MTDSVYGIGITQVQIAMVCDEVKNLLIEKNSKYGDAALNPIRIFSKASTTEQLLVRIDDKLNRIQKGGGLLDTDEDVVLDLIGYLTLYLVKSRRSKIANDVV
jgi:hypothetical protein